MRAEKQSMIDEMRDCLQDSSYVMLADYTGMDMAKMEAFRAGLREQGVRVMIIKNRLFARAIEGTLTPVERVQGPTAMLVGDGEVTAAAKVVAAFIKENSQPALKGGFVDGAPVSAEDLANFARLPSREVLLGQAVGTLAAPMSQLVGVMNQKLASLVYVLRAVEEKKKAS